MSDRAPFVGMLLFMVLIGGLVWVLGSCVAQDCPERIGTHRITVPAETVHVRV